MPCKGAHSRAAGKGAASVPIDRQNTFCSSRKNRRSELVACVGRGAARNLLPFLDAFERDLAEGFASPTSTSLRAVDCKTDPAGAVEQSSTLRRLVPSMVPQTRTETCP